MNKKTSIADNVLEILFEVGEMALFMFPRPFETKYDWVRRLRKGQDGSYRKAVYRLEKSGYIEFVEKNGKKFIKITTKGELEALVRKAGVQPMDNWDGKWRVVMFDIPEKSKDKRILLRHLLVTNNFVKLQHSVYVTPWKLNREALIFLKRSGLIDFIRILKVEEMDDDLSLKKKFNLKAP